jgi:hypothetical protein
MDDFAVFFPFLILIVAFIVVALILVWIFLRNLKPKQEYGVESVTLKGERVKSIAERRIADYFKKNHIYYVYEQKPRGNLFSLPDFYLPVYDVYVEYWGLVNADDRWTREKYEKNMRRKMAIYHRNNIKFISIYPDNLENLDWVFRRKFKEITGFELLY